MAKNAADSPEKNRARKHSADKNGSEKRADKSTDTALDKKIDLTEEFMTIDADAEFDSEEEAPLPQVKPQKDPFIRRKIEDLLERKRLREELGIYDDEAWEGL